MLFPFFFSLSSKNTLLLSATLWIIRKQQVELGSASPWVGILTLISLDQQEELAVTQSPWCGYCEHLYVRSGMCCLVTPKKMATAFLKDNLVIWPDSFKVKVIVFNLKNYY